MRRLHLIFLTVISLASSAQALDTIQLPETHAVAPDGNSLVFSWAGDLWTSNITGGEAKRLTHHPAPDNNPLISHDGKTVYFNSKRSGSTQVYQIPIEGGTPKQITFHSEGSTLEDIHPNGKKILVSGYRDHAGRAPYRLLEKSLDPAHDETLLFDATARGGRYSPDGKRILFIRSGTKAYRKGYEGSQSSQIWLYDLAKKSFTQPVTDPSGCRYPIWAKNGKSFFYVTARSGSFNLWQHRFAKKKDLQITKHTDDSVFRPILSHDGSQLVYRHLFNLHSIEMKKGKKTPSQISLYHRSTIDHPTTENLTLTSTSDATVTKSGLEWAFTAGGEIWAMDTVLKEPKRLTDSPAIESDIYFSDDSKHLYFKKDNGLAANYWRMSKSDSSEFWWTATTLTQEAVTKGESVKFGFQISPKGDAISYIEEPGTIWIAKPDGSEARKVVETWSAPSYVWSPDGNYLAYAAKDENYNNDIYIIATDGESDPVNVSRHPDNDTTPMWSPNGKTLAFTGRRHSTSTDLFFVHLERDTHFKSDRDSRLANARRTMSKDPAYKKEKSDKKQKSKKEDEPNKEEQNVDSKEEKKEDSKKEEKKEDEKKGLEIDFEDLHKRIQRIPMKGARPSWIHWMPDSKNLIFQQGSNLLKVAAKANASPSTLMAGSGRIIRYDKTDKIYLLSSGAPAVMNKNRLSKYSFKIPYARDRQNHQRMGFRLAWRIMRDSFYDPTLNNRDWDDIRTKYELAAANAPSSEHYGRILTMMLGELNASHMGFTPSPFPKDWKYTSSWREYTPHLGARFDKTHTITYVHPNGPADRPESKLHLGEQLIKVDGDPIRSDQSLTQLLNGRLDRDIVLTVKNPDDEQAEEREVTIRPTSFSSARSLAKNGQIDERSNFVENTSKGKFGYLHVARMAWGEFEEFEHHIYERGAGKDGLIIDVRDNGGGSTADHLLTVLTQPQHAYTVGRNGKIGYPQDRHVYASWNKPIVVLCNENSFSNAEIFSHAIKTLNRGKLVGMPTAGGVISTGSASILNLGRMRLPGRGWFLPHNGEDMELYGAVPHVLIDVRPGDLPSGNDPQLEKAIEVLQQEVKEKGSEVAAPIYRSKR